MSAAASLVASGNPANALAAKPPAHGLGALPPTHRFAARHADVHALDALPASVDLREWAVTPGDQGAVSSCVTWAIDYGMLGWYANYTGRGGQPFAPMYTYSQINGGVDQGSWPTDALAVAKSQGSDTRADYTQGDYDWHTQPTAAEHANAANYKISAYSTLFAGANQAGNQLALEQALAAKQPVAVEIAVRHGFDVLGSNPSAVDNDTTSAIRGYHEVLALGYDANGLLIENSWGTYWANGGFGRLSWTVVQQDLLEADVISGFAPKPPSGPAVTTPMMRVVAARPAARPGKGWVVTYKVAWKGVQGAGGAIVAFDAWYQVDGKPYVPVKLASKTATSFVFVTSTRHHYRFAARAHSAALTGPVSHTVVFVPNHNG